MSAGYNQTQRCCPLGCTLRKETRHHRRLLGSPWAVLAIVLRGLFEHLFVVRFVFRFALLLLNLEAFDRQRECLLEQLLEMFSYVRPKPIGVVISISPRVLIVAESARCFDQVHECLLASFQHHTPLEGGCATRMCGKKATLYLRGRIASQITEVAFSLPSMTI